MNKHLVLGRNIPGCLEFRCFLAGGPAELLGSEIATLLCHLLGITPLLTDILDTTVIYFSKQFNRIDQ